jgi:hypothetical protein
MAAVADDPGKLAARVCDLLLRAAEKRAMKRAALSKREGAA